MEHLNNRNITLLYESAIIIIKKKEELNRIIFVREKQMVTEQIKLTVDLHTWTSILKTSVSFINMLVIGFQEMLLEIVPCSFHVACC